MALDQSGLQVLNTEECRSLLATATLGRIVFTDRALPAIQPVNFALADDEIIIRTAQGSKLAAAVRNAIVAFEIDHFDTGAATGWSVVAVGPARVVTDTRELAELQQLPLRPWAPGRRDHFIRIHPEMLSGRRILDGHGHDRPSRASEHSPVKD